MIKITKFIDMAIKNRYKEYIKANKKQKGVILTELEHTTKRNRKSIIRSLNRLRKYGGDAHKPRSGRPTIYNSSTKRIIELIWNINDNICAERLISQIEPTIQDLENANMLVYFKQEDINKVRNIPLGTLKYLLRQIIKRKYPFNKRKGHANRSQKQIPIRTHFHKNQRAGYFALDFVDHNGGDSGGKFIRTLQFVDPKTTWICRRATIGKDKQATTTVFNKVLRLIPYPIRGLHSDNEPNLLDSTLGQKARSKGIFVTRTRSYMSKDNGHVEQKNKDKVRALVGYKRYDTTAQLEILNKLYYIDDLYQNHFIPSLRLLDKTYNELGKLIKKHYSKPLTAYERVIQEDSIPDTFKEKLRRIHKKLNRVELKMKRDKLLRELLRSR